jgi:diguanylate cyclase (GGDEF)-like protein/PAS domain S-box-containing protein
MELHKDQFLARAISQAAMPVFMINRAAKIVWANDAFCKTMKIDMSDVENKIPPTFVAMSENRDQYKEFWSSLVQGETWIGDMSCILPGDEDPLEFQTLVTPLPDMRGNPAYFLVIQQDVTQQKRETHKMWHIAHHDSLTGLANRTLFNNFLEHTILQCRRTHEMFAVLFVDLDKFKPVNDTYGHHVGDLLLKHAGELMKKSTRETDLVARFGGDEFGIVLTNIQSIEAAEMVASNIVSKLCEPVELEGHTVTFGGSIGMSIYPSDGITTKDLLDAADKAMYAAKADGRNCHRVFALLKKQS